MNRVTQGGSSTILREVQVSLPGGRGLGMEDSSLRR